MDPRGGIRVWSSLELSQGMAERAGADVIGVEAESTTFDVLLSFTGSDNLCGFVDYFHYCLSVEGIRVFRGLDTLYTIEDVQAFVSRSRFYIPIFSTTYAGSPWCLESLALMVEHASRLGGEKEILPVFYDVQPSDVKLETSLYRNALDTHRRTFGAEKVEQWKKGLTEAGRVGGWGRSSYKAYGRVCSKKGNSSTFFQQRMQMLVVSTVLYLTCSFARTYFVTETVSKLYGGQN